MKIAIILGTRPEIIKLSSIIRYCEKKKLDYYIIHTNQHYSPELDDIFFQDLKLPTPKYNLNIDKYSQNKQLGEMLIGIEDVFKDNRPDVTIVQGDTNSVLAGAFVSSRFNIEIAHVEAGLRSKDRRMPEEINRIITDSISTYFFCPTKKPKRTLIREGNKRKNIFIVGNTVVDAILWARNNTTNILKRNNLEKNKYCLLTMHRAENVDDKERLDMLLRHISSLKREKVIFPIHPRTKKMLLKHSLKLPVNVISIDPVGFLDMVTLEKNAKLILTDSGGLQEEACVLKVPCITIRTTTERPESIDVGANILMSENLQEDFDKMASIKRDWKNPFGDGKSGERIINILLKQE